MLCIGIPNTAPICLLSRVWHTNTLVMLLLLEPHVELKKRILSCIGLICTGGTAQYSNFNIESA